MLFRLNDYSSGQKKVPVSVPFRLVSTQIKRKRNGRETLFLSAKRIALIHRGIRFKSLIFANLLFTIKPVATPSLALHFEG